MKLVVLCLFAVTWSALANVKLPSRKLQEVLGELKTLNMSVQHNELMLHTPSQDIEDCCSESALQCFRTQLMNLNANVKYQRKLAKSLRDPLTVQTVTFCNAENNMTTSCKRCDEYPKNDTRAFMAQLESLLQKAYTRTL